MGKSEAIDLWAPCACTWQGKPSAPVYTNQHDTPCSALKQLSRDDTSDEYAYSWGYVIFRTDYTAGSDEAFAKAVARLAIYAKSWTAEDGVTLESEELFRRYYTVIIEDEKTLSGANATQVGERFDAWVKEHRGPPNMKHRVGYSPYVPRHLPNGRFEFCLMFDRESIDNVLALLENPSNRFARKSLSHCDTKGWVKVITNEVLDNVEYEGGVTVNGRWWMRVGIRDMLFQLWFRGWNESDITLEHLGWPDPEDGVMNLWSGATYW